MRHLHEREQARRRERSTRIRPPGRDPTFLTTRGDSGCAVPRRSGPCVERRPLETAAAESVAATPPPALFRPAPGLARCRGSSARTEFVFHGKAVVCGLKFYPIGGHRLKSNWKPEKDKFTDIKLYFGLLENELYFPVKLSLKRWFGTVEINLIQQ